MLQIYLIGFLGPVLVLTLPVMIATWTSWKWTLFDPLLLALPGALWLYLISIYGGRGRTLSNLIELPLLALLTVLVAWLKGPLQRRLPLAFERYLLPVAALLLPVVWYVFFPALRE